MLFHGLGGNRQSIAAIAQHFADERLRRAHVRLPRPRAVGRPLHRLGAARARGRREPPRALAARALAGDATASAPGASRSAAAPLLRSIGEGDAVRGGRGRGDVDRPLRRARPAGPAEVGRDLPVPRSGAALATGARAARRAATRSHAPTSPRSRRSPARARRVSCSARGYPPTFFFQGRQDFAFGLDQGLAGYAAPQRPEARSTSARSATRRRRSPGRTSSSQMQRALAWFDRYLRGVPNGIETAPKVELAAESGGTPVGSASLPRTVTRVLSAPGTKTIGRRARSSAALGSRARLETFGAPTVDVQAASTTGWSHLVAVLVARTPQRPGDRRQRRRRPDEAGSQAAPRPTIRMIARRR